MNTYPMVLARTIDILLCGWIWRTYDVTISSMCGLALRMPRAQLRHATGIRLQQLLGTALNWLVKGHCESAIKADLERLGAAKAILS